jgi:hypothetical protein
MDQEKMEGALTPPFSLLRNWRLAIERELCRFSLKWRAAFHVSENIAISTALSWTTQPNVMAGGQGEIRIDGPPEFTHDFF